VPAPLAIPVTTPPEDEWADAGWTVQVTATTDAATAEAIAARLRSRGYEAYAIKAPARGQLWYRVRVGRFATRAEAQQLEQRLKTVENLSAAFVTAR
jgi:cell division septation protein DedD